MSDSIEEAQEEEDSYFASMTDIMVGLLFIFIILLMYLVTQIRAEPPPDVVPKSEYDKLEIVVEQQATKIEELEDQLAKLNKDRLDSYIKAADRARSEILAELQREMTSQGIPVEIVPEQGILRIKADLLFDSGKSDIDSEADRAVQMLASALAKVLPCFTVGPTSDPVRTSACNPSAAFVDAVFVEGHTDSIRVSKELDPGIDDNLRLSSRRATNTLTRMLEVQPVLASIYSVTPTQDDVSLGEGTSGILSASAFGDSRPISSNATSDGRRSNRRIDIRLLMYTPRSETIETIEKLVKAVQQ